MKRKESTVNMRIEAHLFTRAERLGELLGGLSGTRVVENCVREILALIDLDDEKRRVPSLVRQADAALEEGRGLRSPSNSAAVLNDGPRRPGRSEGKDGPSPEVVMANVERLRAESREVRDG